MPTRTIEHTINKAIAENAMESWPEDSIKKDYRHEDTLNRAGRMVRDLMKANKYEQTHIRSQAKLACRACKHKPDNAVTYAKIEVLKDSYMDLAEILKCIKEVRTDEGLSDE